MIKTSVITSLYNCSKYLPGYFSSVDKIVDKESCEFLLLHNSPQPKELAIIEKEIQGKPWFRYIEIPLREGLYVTWNRGIRLSKGEYCAVWNVDDVRFHDSLALQAKVLDDNPECGLVTGYLNGTNKYGEIGSKLYKHDGFICQPDEVFRSCIIGCFPMWRKSAHEVIGYFDEQFKCVSDFDFQIRVALHYKIYCVTQSLGIYLENDPSKISNNGKQIYENNIVYLRYGANEKIVLHLLYASLKNYSKKEIVNFGEKLQLNYIKPFTLTSRFKGWILAACKSPINITKNIYSTFKN